jgi:type I restriction enzyme S subunit
MIGRSQTEWKELHLEDLAARTRNALVGGPFGSDLVSADYSPTGVAVIRGENLTHGRWVGGEFIFIPAAKAKRLAANTAGPLDIVFTQRGANHYRQVAVVPASAAARFVISQSQMKLTVDPVKADPLFVYYLFCAPAQQEYLQRSAIQTGVPHTNLSILRKTPLRMPPLSVQRAIAHILGTLDDKIELNRRMNETLVAIARALFKSWFVDFDPVRAKAERRDPGSPEPVADLFPDSFEDSELGVIPAGWSIGPLLSQARLLSGGTPKTDRPDYWDGDVLWATAKDVSQCGQTFLVNTERLISRKGLEESATQLIPALATVVVARGATTGRMVLLGSQMAINQTCYAVETTIESPFALYGTLCHEIDRLVHAAHGSVFDTITTSTFAGSRVILPPTPVLKAYEHLSAPLFHRVLMTTEESHTLASIRDALLPKLVSGELRAKGAEFIVGGAL